MLPMYFFTCLSMLPFGWGTVNCRIACRRCRENLEYPDLLEVYCAMCAECNDRRREWLEGLPTVSHHEHIDNNLNYYGQKNLQDDCLPTPTDEFCEEEPHERLALTKPSTAITTTTIFTTTTTTTTTTTSRTTTRRLCQRRPCIKTTGAIRPPPPCMGMACAMPIALPLCQMCPIPLMTTPQPVAHSLSVPPIEPRPHKLMVTSTSESTVSTETTMAPMSAATTSVLYFYVGVPKKLLKQLQLAKA